MKENIVFTTVNLSIWVQFLTGFVGVGGLLKKIDDEDKILKDALFLEMFVQVIEILFYILLIRRLSIKNMAEIRYFDWFITTPLMLFTSIVYYKYEEYMEIFENTEDEEYKKKLKELTFGKFIEEYKEDIIRIVIFNFLMLLFGYLGERGIIDKSLGFILGFIFFLMAFNIVYKFAKQSKNGRYLYSILFVLWSIYGFAYLFNPIAKNVAFNGLDILAKNFFGIYLYIKLMQRKNKK